MIQNLLFWLNSLVCILLYFGLCGPLFAQSMSNPTISYYDTTGAYFVISNERLTTVDLRTWDKTRWASTGPLLSDVMYEFDHLDSLSRKGTIRVSHLHTDYPNSGSPMMVEREGYTDIYIKAEAGAWNQVIYQFAHEYMHYLIQRSYDRNNPNEPFAWFEESLCELSSLYILSRMEQLDYKKPYVNDYRHKFKSYADNALANSRFSYVGSLTDLILDNEVILSRKRDDRDRNRAVAEKLLPYFLADRSLWRSVRYLRMIDDAACADFDAYVRAWLSLMPEDLRNRFARVPLIDFK